MFQTIIGIINYGIVLIFGVCVSASFLYLLNKKNVIRLLIFCSVLGVLQSISYFVFGMSITLMIYPFLTHIPLFLLFVLYFKKNWLASLFAILASYLCCQISNWFCVFFQSITGSMIASYISHFTFNLIVGYILIRYIAISINIILNKSKKAILILGILPALYYLFDYIAIVFTDLLYSGSAIVVEFIPFLFCLSFLIFSVIYFREYEQKCEIEKRIEVLELQKSQSAKEIDAIKQSEYEITLLRHDMRHFLTNLSGLIGNRDWENAQSYIDEIIQTTNQTSIQKFCENKTINLIITYYANQMKKNKIELVCSIKIPSTFPFSESDFTSILSNGLENAVRATMEVTDKERQITLCLEEVNHKLLLSIKNPFAKPPLFIDDMPVNNEIGHGLGTQSIRYVTEKMNGNCQFLTQEGIFILRVIL